MEYREFDPLPPLAGLVDRVWILEGQAAADHAPEPILADGRPELVLHYGDPFERMNDSGRFERQAAVIYAGQLTSPLLLQPTGRIAVVGIRFKPHGAAAFLRPPQHELAGLTLGLDDVSPQLRRDLDAVDGSRHDLDGIAADVQRVLLRWMEPSRIDPRVRHAAEVIDRSRGRIAVDRLATATGMSRRHLERRFLDTTGISPKRLARIARFQHALRVLRFAEAGRRCVTTAAECGYADQSHFIRDFRQLAGCSPTEHLLRQGEMTGFFIGSADLSK